MLMCCVADEVRLDDAWLVQTLPWRWYIALASPPASGVSGCWAALRRRLLKLPGSPDLLRPCRAAPSSVGDAPSGDFISSSVRLLHMEVSPGWWNASLPLAPAKSSSALSDLRTPSRDKIMSGVPFCRIPDSSVCLRAVPRAAESMPWRELVTRCLLRRRRHSGCASAAGHPTCPDAHADAPEHEFLIFRPSVTTMPARLEPISRMHRC
mmetsp:Transcript_7098/g.20804  ORF Transcript_7098/g.20804 Transcript_7098/m.20804 type:complete len:209 (+) Transcript_7098:884-1510(+)